jgi:predicted permease
LRRGRVENEMDEELRFHMEAHADDLVRRGVPRDEAMRQARLEFGGMERAKEECREARGVNFCESLFQDVRYGVRTLGKSPAFTAIAIGTLALAIGANTAIFSVVYNVVLKPLPYPNPDQLVVVSEAKLDEGVKETGASYLDFEEWRKQNHVFSEIAGSEGHSLTLTGRGDPADVTTEVVTPEMFSLLDAKPLLGRTFLPEDGVKGAEPVVILSENSWRSRFGGDPKIIGSSIALDKRPFTVVGIMPANFRSAVFTDVREIWIPLVQDPLFGGWMARRGGHWMGVLGRLKPGVSMAQAQAEMDTIAVGIAKEFPAENTGWTIRLIPLQQETVGDVKSALLVLLGCVGLVLLIACVNIANLLLTRATSRMREMGIRIALGAGRNRIVRQLLTESAVLGLMGGALGVCLAYWGVRGLSSILPADLPRGHEIHVDGWMLGFALLLSAGASVVFGLAPALFAAGSNVQASLKDGSGQSGQGRGRQRAQNFLAIAEIALAMVLLVGAGLLIRSFAVLTSVNPGFHAEHLVKAEVSLPQFEYSTPQQWVAFSNDLLARVQAEPGMQDSALGVPFPLANGFINLAFTIEGNPPLRPGISRSADYASVSPGYFHVMEIPLLRGRYFNEEDSMSATRVALISETLVQLYFPNQDPIGKRMSFGFPPNGETSREIVGIVGDVRDVALHKDPGPMMYVPFAQAPIWGGNVIVRSDLSAATVANAIREDVRRIDKDLPVTGVETMTDALSVSVAQPRFRTLLLSLFAVVALVLAAAGIFGVISYSVSSRTREIGIRMALGATTRNVLRLILAESARLVLLGLAFGIVAALLLGRILSTLLFGVRPADFLTFASVAILLALVALAAAYLPTRRAMRVDPMVALRYE